MKRTPENSVTRQSKSRSAQAGSYSVIATLVLLVIAIVVNLIVGRLPGSWTKFDTTDTKMYSVGDQSKQIISNLQTDVTVYWIVQSGQEDQNLKNLLASYEGLNSHLKVEKKDPVVYPTFVSQYATTDLEDNSLIVVSDLDFKVIQYDDIFVYDYSDYMDGGSYTSEFFGEKQITSAINYVCNTDRPTVYLTTGHGEEEMSVELKENLRSENLTVKNLNIVSQGGIPDDAKTLLIMSPQTDFSTDELTAIQEFLANGGRLCYMSNFTEVPMPNLTALLDQYGIEYVDGIVMESKADHYAWNYNYNLLPSISFLHDITHSLQDQSYKVIMPLAQGMIVNSNKVPENMQAAELLTTSTTSYAKTAGYGMTTFAKESGDIDGPFTLAVALTDFVTDAKVVVYSTTKLLDASINELVGNANYDLFINSIDWLCDNNDNIAIRVHSMDAKYLSITAKQAHNLAIVMIGVIPVLFLLAGAVVMIRRKRR